MRLGDVTAGAPFKLALRILSVFLVAYVLASWALYQAVSMSLQTELVSQAESESLLLEEIYRRDGQSGLIKALRALDHPYRVPEHAVGVFNTDRLSLAGPISVVPDFVGVARRQMQTLTGGAIDGTFFLSVRQLDQMTLVVGRDTGPLDLAQTRLKSGLSGLGAALTLVILGLGLWASRASLHRLQGMESALRAVADGDTSARLPILGRNDQFDLVSTQMNGNLNRLERLITGMKSTASAIAHDLKTPLSHAQIKLHEAADACETGHDPLPQIERALTATEVLNNVIDAVLRISRIHSSDQSSFAQVDLGKLAQSVTEFMAPLAEEYNQTLQLDKRLASTVLGDSGMIQQALVNLVKNAIIHSGLGSLIVIEAKGSTLIVKDNGRGVPETDLKELLEPFARADAARSTEGSGLGLALVKAVADHHGARLMLESTGQGFVVQLLFDQTMLDKALN